MCLVSHTRLAQACSNGGRRLPRTTRGLFVSYLLHVPWPKHSRFRKWRKRFHLFVGRSSKVTLQGNGNKRAILKPKIVNIARFQEWTEAQVLLSLPLLLALLLCSFCFSLLCLQTSFLYFAGLYGKIMTADSFWDQMEQIQTLPN